MVLVWPISSPPILKCLRRSNIMRDPHIGQITFITISMHRCIFACHTWLSTPHCLTKLWPTETHTFNKQRKYISAIALPSSYHLDLHSWTFSITFAVSLALAKTLPGTWIRIATGTHAIDGYMLATCCSHQSHRINCKHASIRPTARLNRYSALPLPCLTGITNIHIPDCTILVSPPKPLNFPRVSLVLFDIHFELYPSLLAQVSNCTHLYKLIALLAWQLTPAQVMSAYLFDHKPSYKW